MTKRQAVYYAVVEVYDRGNSRVTARVRDLEPNEAQARQKIAEHIINIMFSYAGVAAPRSSYEDLQRRDPYNVPTFHICRFEGIVEEPDVRT